MSDWYVRAVTPIQAQLYLEGYRIAYTHLCRYEAKAPDGRCIKISEHVDDCWQACYEQRIRFIKTIPVEFEFHPDSLLYAEYKQSNEGIDQSYTEWLESELKCARVFKQAYENEKGIK